jgi:hypothetical protein
MTKAIKKDKRHPKVINDWMIYEGVNEIHSVFGVLIAFKSYLKSDEFNKYHAEMIISSIQSLLINGLEPIEKWMDIDEGEA